MRAALVARFLGDPDQRVEPAALGLEADFVSAQFLPHLAPKHLEVGLVQLDEAPRDAVDGAHTSPPRVTAGIFALRFLFGTTRGLYLGVNRSLAIHDRFEERERFLGLRFGFWIGRSTIP